MAAKKAAPKKSAPKKVVSTATVESKIENSDENLKKLIKELNEVEENNKSIEEELAKTADTEDATETEEDDTFLDAEPESVESIEVEDESEEDGIEDEEPAKYEVIAPYKKCFSCKHFTIGAPVFYRTAKGRDDEVVAVTKEYSCFEESICPARSVVIIFDPFPEEVIDDIVSEFKERHNIQPMSKALEEAESISAISRERLHSAIMEKLKA